ncbi:MAG: fructosamine kinase family protein [candidate division Zixibacteria bacterium]|nr:fructosamine kinase family protein [candidate division Zixibacteria bacterium]
MTNDNKSDIPQVRFGPIQWLSNPLRTAIEEAVSEYGGRKWRIKSEIDLSEFACHHCAIVSDGSFAVFFKYSEAVDARRQFEIEQSGLQTLSNRAGVLTPHPISITRVETGTLLIMEALEATKRGPRQWRQIGATLARIHRVKGDICGFETNGFWGPLHQDNTPMRDWPTFFNERRLEPMLRMAIDSGEIPSSVVSKVETLITRLPELCGPEITPTLLHGDAQQNNFICTAKGIYIIDPAVYYANPEMDLATIDSWQPVPDAFFNGYREEIPIDPGFFERRDLWRVPLYLAAVVIEGSIHLDRLANAIQKYL